MDLLTLFADIWDKGAWCVIALLLLYGLHRAWKWLQPFVEQLMNEIIALIKSLRETTKQQADANTANAEANVANAKAFKELTARPAHAAPSALQTVPG